MKQQAIVLSKYRKLLPVTETLIRNKALNNHEKMLYMNLCLDCNAENKIAVSYAYLSDVLNIGEQSVSKYVNSLEAKGYIKKEMKIVNSRKRYEFTIIHDMYDHNTKPITEMDY